MTRVTITTDTFAPRNHAASRRILLIGLSLSSVGTIVALVCVDPGRIVTARSATNNRRVAAAAGSRNLSGRVSKLDAGYETGASMACCA